MYLLVVNLHYQNTLATLYTLLAKFGELAIELYALELTTWFQQPLAHLPSSQLVSQTTSLFLPLCWTRISHLAQVINHVEGIMGSILLGKRNHTKIAFDDIMETFLAKEWNFFHLSRKELNYLHLKDFFQIWIVLERQPLTPPKMQYHCCLPHLES